MRLHLEGMQMSQPDAITEALKAYTDRGEFAGAATLVWRSGAATHSGAVGWRDKAAGARSSGTPSSA